MGHPTSGAASTGPQIHSGERRNADEGTEMSNEFEDDGSLVCGLLNVNNH